MTDAGLQVPDAPAPSAPQAQQQPNTKSTTIATFKLVTF